jgi:hypothetical protein
MGRVPRCCYALLMLLLTPRLAAAIQLHWSDGTTARTFTEATRCTLVVQADSIEQHLPSEWRLLWGADSTTDVNPVPLSEQSACVEAVAQISAVDEPATSADSAAHLRTAHFCSDENEPLATAARYVIDLPGTGAGKFKAVALDPNDSTQAIESGEVTFNGGVSSDYPGVVLHASFEHASASLSVSVVGLGLSGTRSIALAPPDSSWRLPLTLSELDDRHVVATTYLGIPLPACHVQLESRAEMSLEAPLPAENQLSPMAPVGSSAKFVPNYGVIQPKDFAFYFQRQLGIFHVFYIVNNQVIAKNPAYGQDSTEKCIGHAWSNDLEHWHNMDSILTVRADKWDNFQVWAPTIVQKDLQFKMFYTGVQRDASGNKIQRIGLATADATLPYDSLKTWTRRDSAVFSCGQVPWANKNTSDYPGRQFRDPFVMADPDSIGRYLMYYVTIPKDQTSKMVVGVARSAADLSAWRNYGPLQSTEQQYTGSTNDHVESPHVIEHRDVVTGATSRWLFMTTNTNLNTENVHFQRTLQSPSDTLAGGWLPTTDLYTYLGGDSTVSYWHGSEYLPVAAMIGGYASAHEYLAAYDDSTWAIDINEMLWRSDPSAPYYADFTLAYPSLAAVDSAALAEGVDVARLVLLGQHPGVSHARLAVDLPAPMYADVEVLDIQGRRVRSIARGILPSGRTSLAWDAANEEGTRVKSGVYFIRLRCGGRSHSARVVVLR